MDNIFTYRGQNVDELTADQMRDALKQCIHELEQERRYNIPVLCSKHTYDFTVQPSRKFP